MPYIKQERRVMLDNQVRGPENPGDLNYMFTTWAIAYFRAHGQNYQAINDVMGAFAAAGAEFYRRVAAPYEDGKIAENGDVD